MHSAQLDKLLSLIRRTGDRMVVLDRASDEAMVMMSTDEYEKLLDRREGLEDLSERDMLEKVNRDISNWRAYHEAEDDDIDELAPWEQAVPSNWADDPNFVNPRLGEDWKDENWGLDEDEDVLPAEKPADQSPTYQPINPQTNQPGEDHSVIDEVSLDDVPHDEDEETFLLEPVE